MSSALSATTKYVESAKFSVLVLPWIILVGYLLAFGLGIYIVSPAFLHVLTVVSHTLICGFLLLRFHPWAKPELKTYDASLIFSGAILLMFNLVFLEWGVYQRIPKLGEIAVRQSPSVPTPL